MEVHSETGQECEESSLCGGRHGLTAAPILHLLLLAGGGREILSKVKPRKKGALGGNVFEDLVFIFHYSNLT